MKKYFNLKSIFLIISILIILSGIITMSLFELNKSIEYKAGTRIEVSILKGYEKKDIINIAKECFSTDEILFLEIEKTNQVAGIKIIEYSKEELDNYISKISEKYEINKDDIIYYEISVPETKISTIIKPYILPIIFTTCISLIYVIIKNFRNNKGTKLPLKILEILVISLGLYFSFIALLRLEFCMYTMPFALTIYIVALIASVNRKCE